MTTPAIEKVQKDSADLKRLFGWLFGLGVFLVFSQIIYQPLKALVLSQGATSLGEAARPLGEAVVGALPVITLLGALWQARCLFKSFADGQILSVEAGIALMRLGDWLVATTVLWLIFGPAVQSDAPAFGPYLSANIVLGVIGLAIRLFGRVINVAAAVKVDRDQIKIEHDQIV